MVQCRNTHCHPPRLQKGYAFQEAKLLAAGHSFRERGWIPVLRLAHSGSWGSTNSRVAGSHRMRGTLLPAPRHRTSGFKTFL